METGLLIRTFPPKTADKSQINLSRPICISWLQLGLTCVNRRCLREILWFFGLTDSLCLAAVLSKRGADCGTESRLMDSIVPVGGRTRLDLGDFTGVLCV